MRIGSTFSLAQCPQSYMPTLLFDLGGTHLRAAVARNDGGLGPIVKLRIGSVGSGDSPAVVWTALRERMTAFAQAHAGELDAADPVVVSFPGPVDQNGRTVNAPTLFGDSGPIPDVRTELERALGRPVRVLNDLSAAAWSLARTVPGRFLVVTVSSGVGSKIFDPRLGAFDDVDYGGEIGHGIVDESTVAPMCDCGGKGHLGAVASGRGIQRRARQRALERPGAFGKSACVLQFGATAGTLNNEEHLVPALREGDAWTIDIVRDCTRYLARVLVSTLIVAGLRSVIVIGGFALSAGEPYLQILRSLAVELCDYSLLRSSIAARIELGVADEETCLVGAGVFAQSLVNHAI
jgi:predicted NBD/HSP70 family sugar kinase